MYIKPSMKAVSTMYLGLEESPLKLHRRLLRKLSSPLWLYVSVWPLLYMQGFMQVHLILLQSRAVVYMGKVGGAVRGTPETANTRTLKRNSSSSLQCRVCRGAGFLLALQRCPKWPSKHTFVCSFLKRWPPQLHITLHLRLICSSLAFSSLYSCFLALYSATKH